MITDKPMDAKCEHKSRRNKNPNTLCSLHQNELRNSFSP